MGFPVLRTLRNQSGTCGSRTLGSILTGGGGDAGSTRRMYGWYMKNHTTDQFYKAIFDIQYGQFSHRANWFLNNN
jgi:hypothetical protein